MARRYTEHCGIEVDEERVRYYIILESFKTSPIGMTALKAFAEGRTSDLRLVQIGRGGAQGLSTLAQMIGLIND